MDRNPDHSCLIRNGPGHGLFITSDAGNCVLPEVRSKTGEARGLDAEDPEQEIGQEEEERPDRDRHAEAHVRRHADAPHAALRALRTQVLARHGGGRGES